MNVLTFLLSRDLRVKRVREGEFSKLSERKRATRVNKERVKKISEKGLINRE